MLNVGRKLITVLIIGYSAISMSAYGAGCCVNYGALQPFPMTFSGDPLKNQALCQQANQTNPDIVWERVCPLRVQAPLPGTPLYDAAPSGSCQCPSGTVDIPGYSHNGIPSVVYNNQLYPQCNESAANLGFSEVFGLLGCEKCCGVERDADGSGGGIGIAPPPISLDPDLGL